jgi:hypothetical protein
MKEIQFVKEEVKELIFVGDKVVYISDPKSSTRELLQLIDTFIKGVDTKKNLNKSVSLLYTSDKWD